MRYLARGAFWSIIGQMFAIISTLILAIIVSNFLPKDVYGQYKYVLSIVALISAFSLTGISTAVFQSTAKGFNGALPDGFKKNLQWSIFIFIGAFLLSLYYFQLHNTTLAISILIGGCLSPILVSGNLSSTYLFAKGDFARQTIYFDIIKNTIPVVLLITTILLTQNPIFIVSVYFLSNTLTILYLYFKTLKVYRPHIEKTDPEMLTYAKHISFMGIFGSIASNIDQVLLFHFVGPIELAIYSFAIAIPDQIKGPLKTLNSMLQAKFAIRTTREIRSGMNNKILILFISSLLIIGAYILIAPLLFKIFFPKYIDAIFYSQIYVVSQLALAFAPTGSYLIAKKKIKEQYIINIVVAVLQISILFVGVLLGGLLGVIIARVITKIGSGIFSYILYITSSKEKLD